MKKPSKLACVGNECVACGCCAAACPLNAIRVTWGIVAQVDEENALAAANVQKLSSGGDHHYGKERCVMEKKSWYDYLWIGNCSIWPLGFAISFLLAGMLFLRFRFFLPSSAGTRHIATGSADAGSFWAFWAKS